MGTPVETRSLIGPDKIMPKTTSGYRPQHSRNSSGASTGYSSSNNSEKTTSGHHRTTGSHQRTTSWDYNRSDNQALVDSLFTDLPLKKTTWYPVLPVHFRSTSGRLPVNYFRSTSGCFIWFRLLYTGWDGIFSVCVSFNESKGGVHHQECKNARQKKCTKISRIVCTKNHPLRIIYFEVDSDWSTPLFRSLVPITNHVACPYLVIICFPGTWLAHLILDESFCCHYP